ncbi:hypothetical protein [Ottowia testudinis]|uniref:Uncharacterized protein n=1 Tax=Ottowia testudinis TaxID=2816950 RepID=A0A975H1J1_9BURK|nr:hypothetical protein [Ottowia testudinis]QTD43878.1 hypothetical protein J1M35_12055 [Ottowia testudinis]
MPRLHKKAPCPQRTGQARQEKRRLGRRDETNTEFQDRQAAHLAPPAGRIEARLFVLMALIMVMKRWLRLAFFKPFAAPAGAQQAQAATDFVVCAPFSPLARFHAPPPDRGR